MKLSNYYTQAKHLHSWRTLRISRPLFVGTLLRHSWRQSRPQSFRYLRQKDRGLRETRVIADHVEGFRPIKRKNTLHRMIIVEEEGLMAWSLPRSSWIVWFKMSLRTSSNQMRLVRELKIGLFCEVFRWFEARFVYSSQDKNVNCSELCNRL